MEPGPFSSAEALRFGWEKTRRELKPLVILGLVGGFLALLEQGLTAPGTHAPLRSLLALAVRVLQAMVLLAYLRIALRLHDGQPFDLSRPAELLADFFPYLLTAVLYGLVVAGGLLLLIVPGVIWAIKYGFATFVVVDQKLAPTDALRESSRLTDGVKTHLFLFGLLLCGVNLLGALALGIGLLVTVPTTTIAAAYAYRRLQERAARRVDLTRAPYPPPTPAPAP